MEIIGSALLAILQSVLFYKKEIGISMLVFSIVGNVIISYFLIKKNKIKNKNGFLLLIPIILLSSTYFIFANEIFNIANIFAIIMLNLIMYVILIKPKDYFKNYLFNSIYLLKTTILGCKESIHYTKEKSEENIKTKNKIEKGKIKKVFISFLMVFIVVGIVVMLLASADIVFANMFTNIASIFNNINIKNVGDFLLRLVIILISYILILSFILKLNKEFNYQVKSRKCYNNKYSFTIKLLLVSLNIVYLVFCIIQVQSLFTKNIDTEFDYASYARTGFFQLMFVSFINFAIILISNKFNENKENSIKILNLFLIIFTILIAFSSMYRMFMYQMEFGLTYLRMFVYIILVTEILTFIPIIVNIFNKKFDFIKWSFILWICVYCAINYMNIEKIIINTNINKTLDTDTIDYEYICSIASEDSFDILEQEVQKDNIGARNKLKLTKTLSRLADNSAEMGWQEFNIAKWKVREKNIDIDELDRKITELISEAEKEEEESRNAEQEKILAQAKLSINEKSPYCVYKNIINKDEAYIVELTESATGVEQWTIGKITDNSTKYTKMNVITLAPTSKIEFFENGLGFLEEAYSIYCESSTLSITRDSGKTFEKINLPEGKFTLSDPEGKAWSECYDYPYLPTREDDGTLTVLVSGGYEGGYNGGKTRAKYVSKDNGETWQFVAEVWRTN